MFGVDRHAGAIDVIEGVALEAALGVSDGGDSDLADPSFAGAIGADS